jgi:signal transduction histidine kinase
MRKHWLEIGWGVFAAINVVVVLMFGRWETIPFHFIWVSLTLLYGFRVWRPRTTALVLGAVMLVTGIALLWTVANGEENLVEVTEVPLMAAMFLAMAWHALRRQRAIEEARRAVETERRVQERQQEFVRDASHELRTPITVARGHAELLGRRVPDGESLHDVEVILDELGRLSRLSDRLLTLAGVDHPGFLNLGDVEVEDLVVETIRRWGPTAAREWRATVDDWGTVYADRQRLEAALDALIENSVRATSSGGLVEISARADGTVLLLGVSDDGSGIDEVDLPHVFDRFSRTESDRARESGGTGLGLAIVQAIARAHHGTVEVTSELGRGTTVQIRLPGYVEETVAPQPSVETTGSRVS